MAVDGPGPVYFIGGTFGSGGGSGWLIAIITALVTAFATLGVGYLLEDYKRRRDVRALAETFAAEISAISQIFDQYRIEEQYRELRTTLLRTTLPGLDPSADFRNGVAGDDVITFPVAVYDKCADRVGTLGAEVAADVVRFYNFLNGVRVCVRLATGSRPIAISGRIEMITFMLNTITTERPKVGALLKKLRVIADRPDRPWIQKRR
jgi:hypothetical protein